MFPNVARVPNNWKLFLSVFRILRIEMLHVYQRVESIHKIQTEFFSFWIIINIFFLFCNAFTLKWGFHNEKKTKKQKKRKANTKIYLQDIHNKNIFSPKLLTTNFHPPPNGLCSNFKWCYVENENVIEILTSYKHPLQAQESLSYESQIKNISCFCTPTIIKSNEWVINHWQVNSSPG